MNSILILRSFAITAFLILSILAPLNNICVQSARAEYSLTDWSSPENLSNNTASSMYPAVAVWKDYIHLVWQDNRDGNYDIYYKRSTSSGLMWESEKKVASTSSDSTSPDIAVWENNVHIVWAEQDGIYYQRSRNNGSAWDYTGGRRIKYGSDCSNVRIALNQTNLCIVWQEAVEWGSRICFNSSFNNGETWSGERCIAECAENPGVACWNDTIHIVWQGKTDYWSDCCDIYCNKSTDKGATWSGRKITNNTNTTSVSPAVATNENGTWVVWQDNRDGNYEIYCANFTAYQPNRLTNNPGESKNPELAIEGNRIYIVWSDSRDGNYEVYLKYSDNNGTGWHDDTRLTYTNICISDKPVIAVNTLIHVFWHDNIDKNFEVYYIHSIGPAYCVQLVCEEDTKTIGVNASAMYTITVTNLGNRNDTVALEISAVLSHIPDNWAWELDTTALFLHPQESRTVNLTVSSHYPDIHTCAYVVVTGISRNDTSKYSSVGTLTRLQAVYDIFLGCVDSKQVVSPEGLAEYNIIVWNKGNENDTADLLYLNKPLGWTANLSDYALPLQPNETRYVSLFVQAPAAEQGIAEIKVLGTSRSSAISAYVVTLTTISNFTLYLMCENSTQHAYPGERVNYTIHVWNCAQAGTASFDFKPKLNASLNLYDIYLGTGDSHAIILSIDVPEDALANSQIVITVTAEIDGYSSELETRTIVNQVYNVTVEYTDTFYTDSGRELNINITCTNSGNGDDEVSMGAIILPSNWSAEAEKIFLSPHESENLSLRVYVPLNTTAGKCTIETNITTKTVSFILSITIFVIQNYAIEIFSLETNKTTALNMTVNFTFELKNKGNGNDTILLYPSVPWTQNATVYLSTGETKNIPLYFTIPIQTPIGKHNITVTAKSLISGKTAVAYIEITISGAELVLEMSLSDSNPKEYEPIKINAFVTNIGNIAVYNISLCLYEDDILRDTTKITILRSGENISHAFVLIARSGKHKITVIVDPENETLEANKENNIQSMYIITRSEILEQILIFLVYVGIICGIALAIFGIRKVIKRSKYLY